MYAYDVGDFARAISAARSPGFSRLIGVRGCSPRGFGAGGTRSEPALLVRVKRRWLKSDRRERNMFSRFCLVFSLAMLAGCSATTLRCGTDGESSYVELLNVPQDIAGRSQHFSDLCAFAYVGEDDET
jgi:hypothetical protein